MVITKTELIRQTQETLKMEKIALAMMIKWKKVKTLPVMKIGLSTLGPPQQAIQTPGTITI